MRVQIATFLLLHTFPLMFIIVLWHSQAFIVLVYPNAFVGWQP